MVKTTLLITILLAVSTLQAAQRIAIPNPGFEATLAAGKPAGWYPRYDTGHGTETDKKNVYLGSKSAKFANDSGKTIEQYFYGPADDSGKVRAISVAAGDTYTFTAIGRVGRGFVGSGIKVSLMFSNDTGFVSRVDSDFSSPKSWKRLSLQATVPAEATLMAYSVEYSGIGNAWFDDCRLVKGIVPSTQPVDMSYYRKQNVLIGYPQLVSKADTAQFMKRKTSLSDLKYNMRMVSWTYGLLNPAEADAIVKRLKSQGINIILSGGNRFITTDLEENIKRSKIIADACRKNGLKYAQHLTTTLVKQAYYQQHPEFASVDMATGKPHYESTYDFATVCFNNDSYWADYTSRLDRFCKEVRPDGLMIDEIEFWGESLCGCDWCKAKFKSDTGLSLPENNASEFVRNLNNPVYISWLKWRGLQIQHANRTIRSLMKKYMPDGGFYPSYLCDPTYAGVSNSYLQNGMRLDDQRAYSSSVGLEYEPRSFNNYYNWPIGVVEMKFEKAVNRVLDSNPWIYFYPTQYADYLWQWNLAMATGFNVWFPGEQGPDKNVLQARSALTQWMAKYEKLIGKTDCYADTAVVYSSNTRDYAPEGVEWREGFVGTCQMLTDSHILYKIVLEQDLTEPGVLNNIKNLIMFNTVCLSDNQSAAVENFVRAGGNLIASSAVSLRDQDGRPRIDFALSEVLGVSFGSLNESAINNLSIGSELIGKSALYEHNRSFVELSKIAASRKVAGYIVTTGKDRLPGVVMGKFGKGNAIYFAGSPGMRYLRSDHMPPNIIVPGQMLQPRTDSSYRDLLAGILNRINPNPLVSAGPLPVGVVAEALEHSSGKITGISIRLANCTGAVLGEGVVQKNFETRFPRIAPRQGIEISVKSSGIEAAYLASPDYPRLIKLAMLSKNGRVSVKIPALERFAMVYFAKSGLEEIEAVEQPAKLVPAPVKLIYEGSEPFAGKYNPNDILIVADSSSITGGNLNDRDIGLQTRFLFGTGASTNYLSVPFAAPANASKIQIEICGSEFVTPGQRMPLRVSLNGTLLFEGEHLLDNLTRSTKVFTVPGEQLGEMSTLRIENLGPATTWDSPYLKLFYIKIIPGR